MDQETDASTELPGCRLASDFWMESNFIFSTGTEVVVVVVTVSDE